MTPTEKLYFIQQRLVEKQQTHIHFEHDLYDLFVSFNGSFILFKMSLKNKTIRNNNFTVRAKEKKLCSGWLPRTKKLLKICYKQDVPIDIILQKTILELI